MDQNEVFGRICRDRISGAEGVCIGVIDWMYGCRYYVLQQRVGRKKHLTEDRSKEIQVAEACLEIVEPAPVMEIEWLPECEPEYFGQMCRDKVTDYEGMCIGRLWVFYSEKQYMLQGRYNKQKMQKQPPLWVEEGRVERLLR